MAGDWLKIEVCTPDKPEVHEIAQALSLDPDAVFGKLFRVWSWFDSHTDDGNAPTVTKSLIDRYSFVTGFADAMIKCGWLQENNGKITLPNFDRHNGETAKRRANTAKRVAKHKAKSANAEVTLEPLPREEKRREENKKDTPQVASDIADALLASIKTWKPDFKNPSKATLNKWAADIDRAMRIDGRKESQIYDVIKWLPTHEGSNGFAWRSNVLSGKKLRDQFDKLTIAMDLCEKRPFANARRPDGFKPTAKKFVRPYDDQ